MDGRQRTTAVSLAPVSLPHLRSWRLRRGLTQAQLARRAQVARTTIIAAERDKPVWRAHAARIARALDVKVSELTSAAPSEAVGNTDE